MSGKKVAILHPDLGIGGAENLIINVALALKSKGYKVKIYTPHFDPKRCFQECFELDIEVRGDLFPRTIAGRLIAMCAYIRMLLCAIWVVWNKSDEYDYFILDQVSFPIPILRLINSRVLFYCHYPDKLLSTKRGSAIMRFYRFFLDTFEELTTGMAQTIVVNSGFTQQVFLDNFPIIGAQRTSKKSDDEVKQDGLLIASHMPRILYPPINLKVFEKSESFDQNIGDLLEGKITPGKTRVLTSLNRYERKKNIPLALKAFANFLERTSKKTGKSKSQIDALLVVAGGWDPRVEENVGHEKELRKLADELGITEKMVFLKSISNDQRLLLLENTNVLLYTPENEHFGIVPVEAMHMGCIVMACNSGGPLESVANGETGFLNPPNPDLWGEKIFGLLEDNPDPQRVQKMQAAAKKRVKDNFVMDVFASNLDKYVKEMEPLSKMNYFVGTALFFLSVAWGVLMSFKVMVMG